MLWLALAVVSVGEGPVAGSAQAVKVTGQHLAHTGQVAAMDPQTALRRLDEWLKQGGSSLAQVVKLNVVVASDGDTEAVGRALQRQFGGWRQKPAVSLVSGAVVDGARVAMDAVGVAAKVSPRSAQVGVLAAGRRVYVSGQSASGGLEEATRETLNKLKANLEFAGSSLERVVQVKSFVDPVTSAGEVRRWVDAYFGAAPPPQVVVEWTMKGRIEIEVIASVPGSGGEAIEHLWPPEEKPSPVYCRLARVAAPETIYISGLFGRQGGSAEAQIRDIFGQLRAAAEGMGSDLRHLAKATYYVADEESSRKLNELRPEYYDARRPPAASKAPVRGTGKVDRSVTLDMIAVAKR
jgi:enamine deaminase RidA (YjgF/YER057c/UK114 family)